MIFIENDGALFRGPTRGLPQEAWSARERRFLPYAQAGEIRPVDWGHVITESEAQAMMGLERGGIRSEGNR
ncbi:hypothetical protein D3C71_1723370 [compost metagenome]